MKKPFRIGAAIGGVLGVTVARTMDLILGQGLGEGWSEAVAHDLNRLLGLSLSSGHFLVTIGVILVVSFMGLFGALACGTFSVLVSKFFEVLTREK
jgi:hypothetical protein